MNKKYLPWIFPGIFIILIGLFLLPNMLSMFLYSPKEGDIVFQSLPHNELVDTIEGVTNSPYSHCGIVTQENGTWYVLEALVTVKMTPLKSWAIRGRDAQFEVYRIRDINEDKAKLITTAAKTYLGRKYDARYKLDNDDIYCSELIYLAAKDAAGINIGKLERLGDLNWTPYEKSIVHFEGGPVPMDRLMVTPLSLTKDPKLELIRGKI
jgi:hypothetical protein